ncbi:MAG TPA: signal peptidase II [Marmoricola sp.]|nr:signal peptidase II [Marmoricola sp.]
MTGPPDRMRWALVIAGFVVAGLGLLIDAATKRWALTALDHGNVVQVWGDFLQFVLTHNPGAAFSTGGKFTPFISVFAMVAAVAVCVAIFRSRSWPWSLALGLLLAGILGNLRDRLFEPPAPMRGHVIDFIMVPNWPVFNVADIMINVAGVAAVILVFRGIPLTSAVKRSSPSKSTERQEPVTQERNPEEPSEPTP